MLFRSQSTLPGAFVVGATLLLSACATLAPVSTAGSPAPAALGSPVGAPASSATSATVPGNPAPTAAATAPGARPPAAATGAAPGAPRPFAEIIKDAKEQPGLFTLWTKDEKVWIEIKPEQFDHL